MSTAKARALAAVAFALSPFATMAQQPDPFLAPYTEFCAVCHGANLEGAAQGTPLVGSPLRHGSSVDEISASIAAGAPQSRYARVVREAGRHANPPPLDIHRREASRFQLHGLQGLGSPRPFPQEPIKSEKHTFRVETVATGLDPLPYSIAPLPDGRSCSPRRRAA